MVFLFLLYFKIIFAFNCEWKFTNYISSQAEEYWLEKVYEIDKNECDFLQENINTSIEIIKTTNKFKNKNTLPIEENELLNLSQLKFGLFCKNILIRERIEYIEPLYGILRDPLTICDINGIPNDLKIFETYDHSVQSKRFLLPVAASWNFTNYRNIYKNFYLFDFGASLYDVWEKNNYIVVSKWFIEEYEKFDFKFDKILSFEKKKTDPEIIFKNVPQNILYRYTYYNIGVEKEINSKWNPWNFLLNIADIDDYIVIKIDIDNSEIEMELIKQLIQNKTIYDLVDEMYFEHHVNLHSMIKKHWHQENSKIYLKDTYEFFLNLRKKGIRMHSWP